MAIRQIKCNKAVGSDKIPAETVKAELATNAEMLHIISNSDVQAIRFRPVSSILHDPDVWFAALKSQFETRRITNQRQKYAFALEPLPGDHLVAVRDVILNSNVPNAYDRLSEAILRHFLPSREERLRTL
ncbi:unnamed protein product [Schistosoma mattheei]|uniref:DUF7041 domain-containing protein n=1 Tax=Schistosoma mattheei TaxID=31246 RepID=A0A183Q1G4_9TREM|nr:unnamed protein product [Schistosoma mattheei]